MLARTVLIGRVDPETVLVGIPSSRNNHYVHVRSVEGISHAFPIQRATSPAAQLRH